MVGYKYPALSFIRMKKVGEHKKINRNYINSNEFRKSSVSPEMYVREMWMGSAENTTDIQVLQLNVESSPLEENNHDLIFGNNEHHAQFENDYKQNWRAREKRRQTIKDNINSTGCYTQNGHFDILDRETINGDGKFNDDVNRNYQTSFFTIFNKHVDVGTDSDSEKEMENIDMLNIGDNITEVNHISYDNDMYGREGLAVGNDTEKRTIWIYSFKNKYLLPDNETYTKRSNEKETVSCSTSCSTSRCTEESLEKNEKTPTRNRVATPIPADSIPKLNLTGTLPNVTEITEVTFNDYQEKIIKDIVNPKPIKSWFLNNNNRNSINEVTENSKHSTNVVSWMALSPREMRRRCKSGPNKIETLPTLREVSSVAEEKFQGKHTYTTENIVADSTNKINTIAAAKIKSPKKRSFIVNTINDVDTNTGNTKETQTYIGNQYYREDEPLKDLKNYMETKADYRKPQIKISAKPKVHARVITDPIEKLESSIWIAENREDFYSTYNSHVDKSYIASADSAGQKLLLKNMSLLKPSEWTSFQPITESPPSITISLDTISENEKCSWLMRFVKVLRCCK